MRVRVRMHVGVGVHMVVGVKVVVVVVVVVILHLAGREAGRRVRSGGFFQARDDLDPTLLHPAHREDPIRDALELIGFASHHHDLQTQVLAQMHVQGGPHTFPQLVLQLRQLLAEVTDVVVVDQRQRAHGVDALLDLRAPDRRP